ncbi:MAG: 3-methyl-2-oxobutanoate hydroxymethyltransferase [Betaproteobacteria bacterium]|nr:3-methyl-2-oxobutanoate hydroxymethyltransferase [Betaproteobacteria bacterium]
MEPRPRKKTTLRSIQEMKRTGERIAAIGVYDAPMAAIADEIGFELFVIGNSGPMSLFGHKEAARVPSEDLRFMTQAVSRVTRYALVVSTMPYMSYVISREEGIRTAAGLVSEAGAECVQCHGTEDSVDNIRAIVRAGIPVLAHLGLQSVRKTAQSGYGVRGKGAEEAHKIVEDALALADAGVFAFTLELVPAQISRHLRDRLHVPILSLGSGPFADGIYQVSADVVGFSVFGRPNSSARFCDGRAAAKAGIQAFIDSARSREFPQINTSARMSSGDARKLADLPRRS